MPEFPVHTRRCWPESLSDLFSSPCCLTSHVPLSGQLSRPHLYPPLLVQGVLQFQVARNEVEQGLRQISVEILDGASQADRSGQSVVFSVGDLFRDDIDAELSSSTWLTVNRMARCRTSGASSLNIGMGSSECRSASNF